MIYIKPYFVNLSEVLYIQLTKGDFYEMVIEFKDHSRLYSDELNPEDCEKSIEIIIDDSH